MALPKTSQAVKHYRWSLGSGDCREAVVADIAAADRVSRDEAGRRFDEAKAQHERRAIAQRIRGIRQRGALESMRWTILCLCEVAYRNAPKGQDFVPIDDSLLTRLRLEYMTATKARAMPEPEWVREQSIGHLHRSGLIVRGTAGMRITEAGSKHVASLVGEG